MSKFIPYGHQQISDSDIEAVVKVLRSDWLTQGPQVPTFEKILAKKVGANHAVAVNSATSALHLACLALGLSSGDCLWTVPNTFVASANCGRYCGAEVDFVDINPKTWNINVDHLQEKLEIASKKGLLPKIVVPVHFSGQPTEQERIWSLGQKYGFKVVEDASHSIGAKRNGEPVGSCRWSDITVFSFHPVKIITTGEGGMALTNDQKLNNRMKRLREHGINRDPKLMKNPPDGPWYYEQLDLGYNYRMSDIQAALGLSQLNHLEDFVSIRNKLAQLYDKQFLKLPLQLQIIPKNNYSSRHLYVIRIESRNHLRVFKELKKKGIGVNLHYRPVHLQPYYLQLGFEIGNFPEAEAYGREAISLPLFPSMSQEQQFRVISSIKELI